MLKAGVANPDRLDRSRLARECAKLSEDEEQQLADEGLADDFRQ